MRINKPSYQIAADSAPQSPIARLRLLLVVAMGLLPIATTRIADIRGVPGLVPRRRCIKLTDFMNFDVDKRGLGVYIRFFLLGR
jgi:hypothetical protein